MAPKIKNGRCGTKISPLRGRIGVSAYRRIGVSAAYSKIAANRGLIEPVGQK
jgi:hypothetical protein